MGSDPESPLLRITAGLLRKMISTADMEHEYEITGTVAAALQHTEQTTSRHYVVGTTEEAVRQNNAISLVEMSAMMKEYIISK